MTEPAPAKPPKPTRPGRVSYTWEVPVVLDTMALRATVVALCFRAVDKMEWRERWQGVQSLDIRTRYVRVKLGAPTEREAYQAIELIGKYLDRMALDPGAAMRWVAARLTEVADGADWTALGSSPAPATGAEP